MFSGRSTLIVLTDSTGLFARLYEFKSKSALLRMIMFFKLLLFVVLYSVINVDGYIAVNPLSFLMVSEFWPLYIKSLTSYINSPYPYFPLVPKLDWSLYLPTTLLSMFLPLNVNERFG